MILPGNTPGLMDALMLVDTHAHLDMPEFDADRQQTLERAFNEGVGHVITIGIDLASSARAVGLASRHNRISASVGCHPHHAQTCRNQDLDRLARLAAAREVVAWGEIGLDFYRNLSPPESQKALFQRQLELAQDLHLPIIVHCRDAHPEVLEALQRMGKGERRGVIHCFSGDMDLARAFMELGYFISIPGTVTYKKASKIRRIAREVPLQRLVVETDAPYLAPEPYRGRRNEPAYVVHTAREVARLRGISLEELAAETSRNAHALFALAPTR